MLRLPTFGQPFPLRVYRHNFRLSMLPAVFQNIHTENVRSLCNFLGYKFLSAILRTAQTKGMLG